ncbi:MAG: glycyl-radical enzyme activating protein, partial [Lentisphaeria bacterium]
NDSDENMAATGRFLGSLNITCVKLLPYHDLARSKYVALGLPDTLPQVDSPTDDALLHAANILKNYGLDARSGRA